MEGTTPAKYKYFICLLESGAESVIGFVINSRINTLGQGPTLLPCYAPLLLAEHPFLDHDSWADCTGTFTVATRNLGTCRGHLTTAAAQGVLASVQACPRLKPKTKNTLLALKVP